MFDLYPRHSHRTPQQIAEDTGGSFEPMRPNRKLDDAGPEDGSRHEVLSLRADESAKNRQPTTKEPR